MPAWYSTLLPDGQASFSQNGFLFTGSLLGWRKPKLLTTVSASARYAFRVPILTQLQAQATLVFKTQPNEGDVVAIGDISYVFRNTLVPVEGSIPPRVGQPYEVLIGPSIFDTAQYFGLAINNNDDSGVGEGVHWGSGTAPNPDVFYLKPGETTLFDLQANSVYTPLVDGTVYNALLVGATNFGSVYNKLAVAESTSGVRLAWVSPYAPTFSAPISFFTGGVDPYLDTRIDANSLWIALDHPDSNAIKSPIIDDQWYRYYWTTPGDFPRYTTYSRIRDSKTPWILGIPPPGTAPMVSSEGGGSSVNLGNTTTNSGSVGIGANEIYLFPIVPTGNTAINNINFKLAAAATANTAANWAPLVYSSNDSDTGPADLLGVGPVVNGITTGENTGLFNIPVGVNVNTTYWIGFMIDTSTTIAGGPMNVTTSPGVYLSNVFSAGAPAHISVFSTGFPGLQLWAEGTSTDIIEARSYIYTWISEYGEEGPPSPPTTVNGWSNATWSVTIWPPPQNDLGILRNIKRVRIYRTVPGQGGQTVFFYVTERDVKTDNNIDVYTDIQGDEIVALNDQLASTNWFPPPAGLQGLMALPNGMLCGFQNNEVWFSEPYRPHAWPADYMLTVDTNIVGLGITQGAVVVCTTANPYVLSGITPGQVTQIKCPLSNPCISKGSIVSGPTAVIYMSNNGLIQVTSQGVAVNSTDLWFTREKWQQLTNINYPRAIHLAASYYCLGTISPPTVQPADISGSGLGFTIALEQDNTSFTVLPHPGGHRVGFSRLTGPLENVIMCNITTDIWTGVGLVHVLEGGIYRFDFTDPNPDYQVATWKSKIYQQNTKRNFSAMKVYFQTPSSTPTQNAVRLEEDTNSSAWDTLPSDRYGFLKTYVDVDGTGNLTLISAREIRFPGELLRLPDGFKCEHWQWQIDTRVNISNVQIATTAKELAQQ